LPGEFEVGVAVPQGRSRLFISCLLNFKQGDYNHWGDTALAKEKEPGVGGQEQVLDAEDIKRRLDMVDQRLDSIDSMVTAVAERVMNQPVTLNITCPHCGKNIEITIIGSQKPMA
jgi:hypothetical protein